MEKEEFKKLEDSDKDDDFVEEIEDFDEEIVSDD